MAHNLVYQESLAICNNNGKRKFGDILGDENGETELKYISSGWSFSSDLDDAFEPPFGTDHLNTSPLFSHSFVAQENPSKRLKGELSPFQNGNIPPALTQQWGAQQNSLLWDQSVDSETLLQYLNTNVNNGEFFGNTKILIPSAVDDTVFDSFHSSWDPSFVSPAISSSPSTILTPSQSEDINISISSSSLNGMGMSEGNAEYSLNNPIMANAFLLESRAMNGNNMAYYIDPTTHDESKNRFKLLYALNPEQRKSYHRENRYLSPNPIVIGPKDESFSIESGVVSVELVDDRGMSLSQELSHKQRFLESSPPDQLKRWIHSKEPNAKFTLKIMENSGPTKFRLKFVVDYVTSEGQTESETIFSNSFIVHYNKKKRSGSLSSCPGSLAGSMESVIANEDFFSSGIFGSLY
eukprot:TRINITY_DN169_c0_g2_i1.p1 TRINITY_DN169_c0_g2~~TRINITY_DN169_c0_g2_i1.p1  ORF type:complete len:409 (+),score=85.99 TRINITY_DN169_c0_g2_i1:602-1828(+)